eukprot:240576_1
MLPLSGLCPNNLSHHITIATPDSDEFIMHQSCNKCHMKCSSIYNNGVTLPAHYYHCNQCNEYICFNCAKTENMNNEKYAWNVENLRSKPVWMLGRAPKVKLHRLKINNVFKNSTENELDLWFNCIIKLFGGMRETLHFITENASDQQLSEIWSHIQTKDTKNTNKSSINCFNILSDACNQYICSFLNHKDLDTFKMACRSIAVISLQEIRKIPVSIINGNNLLNNKFIDAYGIHSFVNEIRYPSSKLMRSVHNDWANQLQLHETSQIVFKLSRKRFQFYDVDSIANETVKKQCYNQMIYKHRIEQQDSSTHLLIDSQKVVILNKQSGTVIPTLFNEAHNIDLRFYDLIILKYFDIIKQQISVVQYILCKKNKLKVRKLLKYIENNFTKLKGLNNKWYDDLNHVLRQMNDDIDQSKLSLYEVSSYDDYNLLRNKDIIGLGPYNMYTFQLNTNHSYFENNNPYDLTGKIVECDRFCNCIRTVTVNMSIDTQLLGSCFSDYYNNKFTAMERTVFKSEIQNTFGFASMKQHECKLRSTPYITQIKKKISKLFDNIVDEKQIELTDKYGDWLSNPDTIFADCKLHIILPNDVMNIQPKMLTSELEDPTEAEDYQMNYPWSLYKVKIYSTEHCPYPIQYTNSQTRTITFKYYHDWVCKDFINFMFELMSKSPNHILMDDKSKDLVDIYYNENKDEDSDLIQSLPHDTVRNIGNYKLAYWEDTYNAVEGVYDFGNMKVLNPNDGYSVDKMDNWGVIAEFHLYHLGSLGFNTNNNTEIKIKFITHNLNYIGLPLTVFVGQFYSLRIVVNKYLNKVKERIINCYKLRNESKKKLIQKHKWDDRNIFSKNWNYDTDVLLVKIRTETAKSWERRWTIPVFDVQLYN